jgi:hypothetical protein
MTVCCRSQSVKNVFIYSQHLNFIDIIIKSGHGIKAGFNYHYEYLLLSSNDNSFESSMYLCYHLFIFFIIIITVITSSL